MHYFRSKFGIGMISLLSAMAVQGADAISTTVEGVFLKKAELTGKQIQIKGKVVKVNNGVMKRNFLHIQDGTGGPNTNDVTVTSDQTAAVGDQVTVTGSLSANVDFGAGYTYPLIVEKASIEIAKAK
jgi:hypothetical protein